MASASMQGLLKQFVIIAAIKMCFAENFGNEFNDWVNMHDAKYTCHIQCKCHINDTLKMSHPYTRGPRKR